MRNRTYGGVRGRETKVGEKLLRFPPTRFFFHPDLVGWDEGFLLVYLKTIEAVSFPIVEREGLKNVNLGSFSLFMGIL